ncbi:16S rRNA (guanine(966)-N(2))-methyltransferase RsmD [Corynebacterium sp. TAE3-ERU12]|uniref:16S rRNA (guanine(966)-N(2))-methyltransferase RsmD n=1 Tax=Corynebacterium sp. TAE3-ERU12 TaxID=2849491 RepID=UPI001C4729C1|nr:16S rRNA (guanine(966)-N(2))-methyltransferase RsmD [Corynebacterium sp. TAE3-ERU12]MBV7295195.1 16S rRNA (guanine(966)-N(2))-methyltransferase RsmD [Corynebacterium sp. TAE3-ERU12]
MRIIAGIARGRRINAPKGERTRPTSDRAREAIFSSWQQRFGIENTVVLDLFAGSGAMGLEALSRGAREVVLVDNDAQACAAIAHNIGVVKLPGAQLVELKASTYLKTAPQNYFDRVIADPPYELAGEAVTEMLEALRPALRADAVVTVERAAADADTVWPQGYSELVQKRKRKTHGHARFDTAIYVGDNADREEEA